MPATHHSSQHEDWWGLKRKLIAYRQPTPIRRREACAAGLLLGCGIVAVWFLLGILGFPNWTGIPLGDWPQTYLAVSAALLCCSALIGLAVPVGRLNAHDAPWQSKLWLAILHLRDNRYFLGVDWFLRAVVPMFFLYVLWGLHLPWIGGPGIGGMFLIAPLVAAVMLAAWAVFFVPRSAFFFRKELESSAKWVLKSLLGPEEWEVAIQRRNQDTNSVESSCVPRDSNPSFLRTLAHDLPEELRAVGVVVPREFSAWVQQIRQTYGGALYQTNNYAGTLQMVRPWELPGGSVNIAPLRSLTAQIASRALTAGWSRQRLAAAVLAFVQREIRYDHDEATTDLKEYGRFPLETLIDGHGDCECTAVLCVALLSCLGFASALVLMPNHAAVALRAESAWETDISTFDWRHRDLLRSGTDFYLFGETATDGPTFPRWGEIPDELLADAPRARIVIIPPTELPQHGWSAHEI